MFSFFKGLAGQKTLTLDDITPVLDKMKEHLIGNTKYIILLYSQTFTNRNLSTMANFWGQIVHTLTLV